MDTTNLIITSNFPKELILFLVFIPLIATLISIGRYILGLKTLGIYAPIILSVAYMFTGIVEGLVLTLLVVLATIIGHKLLSKFRMHYITRIAANYTILATFLITGILLFNLSPLTNIYANSINPIGTILIATLSDSFIKMYIKKNLIASLRALLETLIVSICGWILITSQNVIDWMIGNIWIVPVLILFNLALGQYSGFRLKEIFRFGKISKDAEKDSGNR